MDYAEAVQKSRELEERYRSASVILKSYPKDKLGLISDEIKRTSEYKTARRRQQQVFSELQSFNQWFVKRYAKELKEDREARKKNGTYGKKENVKY